MRVASFCPMYAHDTATDGLSTLPSHSIYGRTQRAKRGLLRLIGRWSRTHYDVELVFEQGVACYKKITFTTREQAHRTHMALERFGTSPHLPYCHRRIGHTIWVDFVSGSPCQPIDDAMMPAIAECFTHIADHQSRLVDFADTPYADDHAANLAFLAEHGITDSALLAEMHQRSARTRPRQLRIGFDYRDPIAPNLLYRPATDTICAIDVKNLHNDTLVGEGMAKAADRWLTVERRDWLFARLEQAGLADIVENFDYIALYERAARARRKVERDLKTHGRIRQKSRLHAQLVDFLTESRR